MSKPVVLIIDDEAGIRESLSDILTDEGYRVFQAETGEQGIELRREHEPSLVMLDVWLPGMDGLAVLQEMMLEAPGLAVVMISGHGNIETAVKATQEGAYDFLEKPLSLERVVLIVNRAMERHTLENENRRLRASLQKKIQMVGSSPILSAIREKISMAARGNGRVLITGESGTGKELVARLLHDQGARSSGPFVEVNCAAIPQELIESELFGHEKGSFTGAFEQKKGKFELSDGGTLFLDEIGDMSLQTQAKLLRVLETQRFQRVGGNKDISVDVQVLAATNKDLEEMSKNGSFRSDLYYRLNVIPISIPPLRERKDDIPELVEYFLGILANEYGQAPKILTSEAMDKLKRYEWPGNIRELKNIIERVVIMSPSSEITPEQLELGGAIDDHGCFGKSTLKEARDSFEKEFIRRKLEEHEWNISKTAEAIDIERSNLHRKIKSYGLSAG
jgi:two-component system nitrogen regulation response regulator NtrX